MLLSRSILRARGWGTLVVLLAVLMASALQSARLSVCHGDCGAKSAPVGLALLGQGTGQGAGQGAVSPEEETGSCCPAAIDPAAIDPAAARSDCPCCDLGSAAGRVAASDGDLPAPRGALDSERPSCCSVLEFDFEPGIPFGHDAGDPHDELGLEPVPEPVSPDVVEPTARHSRCGRAPPRVDRVTALRASTVLLL